jgi:hypothetical protein
MPFIDRLLTDVNEQITLTEIKGWLKVEHTLDDDLLNDLKEGAVHEAFNFMQNDFETEVEETGELVNVPIPFNVKTACLMYIAYLYENRGDQQTTMPLNCMKLLNPYRKLVGL